MPQIPLTITAYEHRSRPFSSQRLVNLYFSPAQAQAKTQGILLGTPARLFYAAYASDGPCRGAVTWQNRAYFVMGGTFVRLNEDKTFTAFIGTVEGGGPVSIALDPNYIIIATGEKTYQFDGLTFFEITDPDLVPGNTVAYIDGFTIGDRSSNDLESGRFQSSDAGDPTSYGTSLVFSAETNPDKLIAVAANDRFIWLFGETTIELWRTLTSAPFFQRSGQTSFEIGLQAIHSIADDEGSLFFLGVTKNGGIKVYWATPAGTVQAISNDGIETLLEGANVSDAEGWVYRQDGHIFYVLTLPSADRTLVYDRIASELVGRPIWHERMSGTGGADEKGRWNAAWHTYAYGKHLVGDAVDGCVYELSLDTYQDSTSSSTTEEITSIVTTPVLGIGERRNFMRDLWLDVEAGVSENQRWRMSHSDDGGNVFSREREVDIGGFGNFNLRALWRQMPPFRTTRILKFKHTDNAPRRILGLYTEGGPGSG